MDIIFKHILFVCTGNTCRSPFAELMMKDLLNKKYKDQASDFKVSSAGTYAFSGVTPPEDAVEGAKKFRINPSVHKSRTLHLSMLESADIVFCMTAQHKAHLLSKFPWFEDRIFVLKRYAEGKDESESGDESFDIPDPIGGGRKVYEQVYEQIKICLEKILIRWESQMKLRNSPTKIYKIALGSDHAGFRLKEDIKEYLVEQGHKVEDWGADNGSDSVDYPDFAKKVCQSVIQDENDYGILVCGSGVGMSITANRFHGIRAALCRDPITARLSRSHNDTNILALGERFTTPMIAREIVREWLATPFDGGRHQKRVEKIEINPKGK